MRHQTCLQRIGLVTLFLATGVLGGMVVPLSSEAATPTSKPKLTINGEDIPLTWQGNNCIANNGLTAAGDNYFLSATVRGCWTVNGTTFPNSSATLSNTVTIGGFVLGSVSPTNRARVIINDYTNTGEDKMKLTGITFKSATNRTTNLAITTYSTATSASDDGTRCKGSDPSVTTDDCQVAVITLINTFDNNGGENAGDPNTADSETYPYRFTMNIGATFSATSPETNIGSRIRLIATVCSTWVAHADNQFGCDVSNTSTTYTRAAQTGKDGIGANRVGIGNFANASNSYLHSGVLTSGTLSYKTVPLTAPNPSPTIITNCVTNIAQGQVAQCMPTVRLDYVIWVQGSDTVMEQASPGVCGGSCNTVRAITVPKKAAVLYCGDDPTNQYYEQSLHKLCQGTISGNIKAATDAATGLGATEAQSCQGAWCLIVQGDGTPPQDAEGKKIKFTASGLSGLPNDCLPSTGSGCTLTLDSFESGVQGRGVYTLSDLSPSPIDVLTILISDWGPFTRLDNVVCSGGAVCQTLYDGTNSSMKIGFTVTGWAETGNLIADLHLH